MYPATSFMIQLVPSSTNFVERSPDLVIVLANGRTFDAIDVLRLTVRMNLVVDPFHFKGHKHGGEQHVKEFCQHRCNPEHACTIKHRHSFVNGNDGERLANLEAQEQIAKVVGQFQKSVRSFRSLRAEAFLYMVQSIHRETVL